MFNYIELFAGSGGLGMGISKAGFQQVAAIEKDFNCYETLNLNKKRGVPYLKDWNIINCDIQCIDLSDFKGRVSLISGGPPCQPFSFGGSHLANKDARDMFPETVRVLGEVMPDAFIFENVPGLTRRTFAEYYEYVKLQLTFPLLRRFSGENSRQHFKRLQQLFVAGNDDYPHYNVLSRVLNAADFGLPQKRERLFIVGFRSDLSVRWYFPEATHSYDSLLWSQHYGDYWTRHKVPIKHRLISLASKRRISQLEVEPNRKPWKTIREAICDLPNPNGRNKFYLNHEYRPGARIYPGHTGSPIDEPAKTLKAGVHGVPGGENMIRYPDGSVRYFTIRESARMQTFPDEYSFSCSWGKAIYQLGNAVPLELAYILADSIKISLSQAIDSN